jgi:hypothetical protein
VEPDTAAVSAVRLVMRPVLAGQPLSTAGGGRRLEQGGDMAVAGSRPSMDAPPGYGSGRQPPPTVSAAAAEP